MGVEYSRSTFVDLEQETKNRTIEFWKDEDFKPFQFLNTMTLGENAIKKASHLICQVIIKEKIHVPLQILEVGSGSGLASKILTDHLTEQKINHTIIKTDIAQNEFLKTQSIETCVLSHDAVKKYGMTSNILLLISPPPKCYMDYYAIKEYELQPGDEKYVIYIGELGASDGGEGMYLYMKKNSIWDLIYEELLYTGIDIFGGSIEKYLYIFKINRQKSFTEDDIHDFPKRKPIAQAKDDNEIDNDQVNQFTLGALNSSINGTKPKQE